MAATNTDKTSRKNANHRTQREKLGIGNKPGAKSAPVTPPNEPRNAMQKVEVTVLVPLLIISFLA